jgi:eukaryotic-like serine/threonine-protein kinase
MTGQIPLPAHYEITDTIGRSPLCSLFKGNDTRSGTPVAIRIIHAPAWLDEAEASVYRSRIVGTLQPLVDVRHPALASVHEVDQWGPDVLSVRQYVEGRPLGEILRREGTLPVERTVELVAEAAEGLDALHAANMQHGSLTAENLFVATDGSIRIADARARLAVRTMPLAGIECRFASRVSAGDDIAALAGLAYEAMTGIAPAKRDGTLVTANDLPQNARRALRRALQGDASPYRSATAFALALRPATNTEIFQVAWRPAAAVGLLGALATMGGTALSEEKSAHVLTAPGAEATSAPGGPYAIKPADLPVPPLAVDALSTDDRSALHAAIRQRGESILGHPIVAELFGLRIAQITAIDQCLEVARQRVATIVEAAAYAKTLDTSAAMRGIRESTGSQIRSILDKQQRAAWQKLMSEAVAPGEPAF